MALLLTLSDLFLAAIGMFHEVLVFLLTTLLYGVSFGMCYALRVARQLRARQGRRVHVELVADPGHMQSDTSPLLMLGSTQKYLFLYDPAKQVPSILPASNIARLTVDRRRARQDGTVTR